MKNKLPNICYWCGEELTKETKQREHVPPLNFFPKGNRTNLMTVPSCKKHNQDLSELDEKYQFLIKSFLTNEIAFNEIRYKYLQNIERIHRQKFFRQIEENTKVEYVNGKKCMTVQLEKNEPDLFIEKIIRGIYFYHKEKPAKGIIQSLSKRIKSSKLNTIAMIDFLYEDFDPNIMTEGEYNNPKVFKYKYFELNDSFVIIMNFYEKTEFIGWKFPEGFTFENNYS